MDESIDVLRLEIEGHWSARDFGQVLSDVTDLYSLRLVLQLQSEDFLDTWDEIVHFKRWVRRGGGPRGYYPWLATAPLDAEALLRIAKIAYPKETLQVRKIQYASPGVADLAGVGVIVGHIKDFIFRIIEHWSQRRKRQLDDQEHEAKILALRIENARQMVSLAERCGYDQSEVRKLVGFVDGKQDALVSAAAESRLVGVHVMGNNDKDRG